MNAQRLPTAFADNLAIQFLRITAVHPQLLDAVPPAPLPPMRDGTISFNTADFWKQFAQREWQPRATQSAVNLVGPFRMYGHCLDPVAVPDELHWYDPSTPAQDEDIVLVQWDPAELQAMYERNAADADWTKQYGPPCPIATKVYKTIGSSQWLLTRKSMVRLGNNRILGVLRKVVRPESAYVQCPAVSLIEPNAATETYQISDLAQASYGLGSHFVVDGSFTPNVDGVVELSASYDYRGLAEDSLANPMQRMLFVLQNSSYSYGVIARNGAGNTTWISQTHSDFFSVVSGASVTYGLLISNSSGLENMVIRNARMKAGFIKR